MRIILLIISMAVIAISFSPPILVAAKESKGINNYLCVNVKYRVGILRNPEAFCVIVVSYNITSW